jgi:hypothetical protein
VLDVKITLENVLLKETPAKNIITYEIETLLSKFAKEVAKTVADCTNEFLINAKKIEDEFFPDEKKKECDSLIEPVDMLKNEYAEQCFQQYSNGEPQKWYYKNCGAYEENVVVIWWDDEDNRYRTSAEHRSELKTLNSHVKCKLIDKSEMPVDLP